MQALRVCAKLFSESDPFPIWILERRAPQRARLFLFGQPHLSTTIYQRLTIVNRVLYCVAFSETSSYGKGRKMATLTEAPEILESARSDLRDVRERLNNLAADIQSVIDNPLPDEFTGEIVSYSFSNGDGTGPNGRPSHRFVVKSENGLWLYVNVGSDKMDEFIEAAQLSEVNAEALQGKFITVRREPDYADGRMVPVNLLERIYLTRTDGTRIVISDGITELFVGQRLQNSAGDLKYVVKKITPGYEGAADVIIDVTATYSDGSVNDNNSIYAYDLYPEA